MAAKGPNRNCRWLQWRPVEAPIRPHRSNEATGNARQEASQARNWDKRSPETSVRDGVNGKVGTRRVE